MNFRPEAVVLHSAGGSLKGLELQFLDPATSMSSHYGVAADGAIRQFVEETDTAFHAGVVESKDWKLLKEAVNPNYYTIGVTFAGLPTADWTQAQYDAGAQLIASICERWSIPTDVDNIIAHQKIRPSKTCPGSRADLKKLIGLVAATPAQPATVAEVSHVRTIGTANLRAGSPSTDAPVAKKLPGGTPVTVAGFTTGEKVQGNSCWYIDGEGNFLWAGATDAPRPQSAGAASTDEMSLASHAGLGIAAPSVEIDRLKLRLPRGQYHDELTAKDLIVLHFTAGSSAQSAFNTWMRTPERVATAYIVDTDGTIYETFEPARWAPHLGIKGTYRHDKRSIGIEIANVGPLRASTMDASSLNWWLPDEKFETEFCKLSEERRYVKRSYRKFDHYAAFPVVQVQAVAKLVDYLCERFGIPRIIAPASKREECDGIYFENFKGIATHANFRADKYDIGPAFDWARLEADIGSV